ncbi:hypothetical protein M3Y99_00747500 [Aphelenchoides fujianensis]|nr:hypothetical protein M3Y99_00747500 [Aphelenchoides fujianensis]
MIFEASYASVLSGHRVIVTPSPSPPASVCSETPRTRRRRLFLNRACATWKESFTIKMADEHHEEAAQLEQQKAEEASELHKGDLTDNDLPEVGKNVHSNTDHRNSRESSDYDLVHLSVDENNGNGGGEKEDEGEKTPALSPSKIPVAIPKAPTPAAQQEVDLKFERRDSAAGDSSTVLSNPYLSTGQRSDLKEPHFDEIKPPIQLDEPSVLKRAEKKIDECGCGVWNSPCTRRAVGIAALATAIGAVVYYKYR